MSQSSTPPNPRHNAPEQSAVERSRLEAARNRRLESHMLVSMPQRSTAVPHARNPKDLHDGVDVSELPDTAFDELFKAEDK